MRKLVIIFIFTFAISCSKTDILPPVVFITMPEENTHLVVDDSINIDARLIDDQAVEYYTLSLVDLNYNPVQPVLKENCNGQQVDVNTFLSIKNSDLDAGEYIVKLTAGDGTNEKSEFVHVFIDVMEKTREAVLWISNYGNNSYLYSWDESEGVQILKTFSNLVVGAEFDGASGRLFVLFETGVLKVFTDDSFVLDWEYTGLDVYPFDYSGSIYLHENRVYVSDYEGYVRIFDFEGIQHSSIQQSDSQYITCNLLKEGEYFISELISKSNQPTRIEKSYAFSGIPVEYIETAMDVLSIMDYSSDYVMIWGNENQVARVCTLQLEYYHMYDYTELEGEILYDVVKAGELWYFTMPSGLYAMNNQANDYLVNVSLSGNKLCYDEIAGELLVAVDQQMMFFQPQENQISRQFSYLGEVVDIMIKYNK